MTKQKKSDAEKKASSLLESIDDTFRDEPGNSPKTVSPNTLKSRIFRRSLSNVSGGRLDPNYFCKRYIPLLKSISNSGFPCISLRQGCSLLESGKTPAKDTYSDEETSHPLIKVASYTGDEIDLDKVSYADFAQPYKVQSGDIFILSAAHQPEFVGRFVKQLNAEPKIPTSFVGELIRVRAKEGVTDSSYLFALLSCSLFQTLLNREKRGQTSHIYSRDIGKILIPLPEVDTQQRVAKKFSKAMQKKKDAEKKSDILLESIDDILLDKLGIPRKSEPPNTLKSRIFRRNFSAITGDRFDPNFHQPRFEKLSILLREMPHATIRDLVRFSSEQWDQKSIFEDTFPYIEIGSVDLAFGQLSKPPLISIAEAANRAKMIVRPGDLLISLTRPTRRAICFAPDDLKIAVASNGFSVVHELKNPNLNRRFLFHLLRSRLCVDQFDQRSSGGNYPAITEEQLSKLIVPVPSRSVQQRIVRLLDHQYRKAEELLAKAHADLEKSKRDIETLILGKETTE